MEILWLKFPDEVLFTAKFSADQKRTLENVFSLDPASPWMQAIALLRLKKPSPETQMIKWHHDAPYFNWSVMASTISNGAMQPVKTPDGQYGFTFDYFPASLWGLISAQWTMTKFLQVDHAESLAESIALGLVMQSLIVRLGQSGEKLAQLMANPSAAKASQQKIIKDIQSIQMQRTNMSHVWTKIFPAIKDAADIHTNLPDFFWDDTPGASSKFKQKDGWKGLPVCAGTISGLAVKNPDIIALTLLKKEKNAPVILVFRHARPQAVEFFPYADALVFCEGGVLSHACTVAREMNIPCVTGVGSEFFEIINEKTWLTIDGSTGQISEIKGN